MRTAAWMWVAVATAVTAVTATGQSTVRRSLEQSQNIQQIPCAKGYAWFYAGNRLQRCTVAHEAGLGEARIPAGSIVQLWPDGTPNLVRMAGDTNVAGMLCSGGSWLGVAEGPVVAFYPSGKVRLCFLARDQEVQGVPCSHGGFWATALGSDPGIYLYESGRLRQCRLARDYEDRRRGDLFKQAP